MKTAILIYALFVLLLTGTNAVGAPVSRLEKATFAGGCFWCMVPPFEKLDGVHEVVSGYTGGEKADPTYEEVSSGSTGHVEAIEIIFDPAKVSYRQILDVFWRQINPTDDGGQFVDRGSSYRTAIFYHTEDQMKLAEESKHTLARSGRFDRPIITQIRPAGPFYRAEDYHQDYWKKNPLRYKFYRYNSGRDQYLEKVWGKEASGGATPAQGQGSFVKPNREELKKQLTPVQFDVTQNNGTEPAFRNEYWNNKRPGIYVDVVSGEPLFSSLDMYDSGTGWPSFTKPLEPGNIVERKDRTWYLAVRTEVRSKNADSHLGHVFNDGPLPTGLRYCMNSAALRFVPRGDMEREGYGKYAGIFTP